MSTFHLFPNLPKEMRLQIYEQTFEPRILQLGVDAGVPFPPELKPLQTNKAPTKQAHTRLPTLLFVCKESRDLCKSVYIPFGPIFIHPQLDTLYISLYAVGRMGPTDLKGSLNDEQEPTYSISAFDKVAIEIGVKDLPQDLQEFKDQPWKWQRRHGIKEFCARGMWPTTDYAELFKIFGSPREVLIVTNGAVRTAGGGAKMVSWRSIKLVGSEVESEDQEKLVQFLKDQLPASLVKGGVEFKVVDAVKEESTLLAFPYAWTWWRDMTERHIWV